MNSITLVGRIVRDPESRSTSAGKNYATFAIAVRKRIKPTNPDEKDSDFFNVKCWAATATYVAGYLAKGSLVSISGRMESRKYTDKEGQNREIWEVAADQVNGLDRKPESTDSNRQPITNKTASGGNGGTDYDPFAED